jgi:hypothetical protein
MTRAGLVPVEVVDAPSGRRLWASVQLLGDDVVVAVGGGDRPHVGCVVLAVPVGDGERSGASPSVSLLTIPPHKEEPIARAVATEVCRRHGRVTVVAAGVHEDRLDRAGIETYLRLGKQLARAVADRIGAGSGDPPAIECRQP